MEMPSALTQVAYSAGVRDWTVIFLRKRFTSADIRCSTVAGGADAAEADSCYVGNWSSRTPMSGLRWEVVLVVTTGQYAHVPELSRCKEGSRCQTSSSAIPKQARSST